SDQRPQAGVARLPDRACRRHAHRRPRTAAAGRGRLTAQRRRRSVSRSMADAQAADRIGHTGGVSASHQPVILVADDDPKALSRTEAELRRRYGEDYQVACECDTTSATGQLERLRAGAQDVALVLADVWMAERPGSDVLARARDLHPHAKRALLIDWGA